eukprot:586640-Rhodomonas_salina.6
MRSCPQAHRPPPPKSSHSCAWRAGASKRQCADALDSPAHKHLEPRDGSSRARTLVCASASAHRAQSNSRPLVRSFFSRGGLRPPGTNMPSLSTGLPLPRA